MEKKRVNGKPPQGGADEPFFVKDPETGQVICVDESYFAAKEKIFAVMVAEWRVRWNALMKRLEVGDV